MPENLSWSHYRELITVPDKETRIALMRRAEKSNWSAEELAQKIRQEVRDFLDGEAEGKRAREFVVRELAKVDHA